MMIQIISPVLSLNELAAIFFSILLCMIGFFLTMFYKKVDQIAADVKNIQIHEAARNEKFIALDKRVTVIENKLSIN